MEPYWGNSCPDDLVIDYLVDGKMPDSRETTCAGEIAEEMTALAPADAADFESPLQALQSAENEIDYLPEIYYWDGEIPGEAGCPYGGSIAFSSSEADVEYKLERCAFSKGFVMSGKGKYTWDTDEFRLEVDVSGLADGSLFYSVDEDGNTRVGENYGGKIIDIV